MVSVILLFVLGLVLICFGGDKLVDASVALARKIGIPQIVVGATIVSIGTTLPEILVSTTAAFDGSAAISAGNAFGSIICNTALIAGLTQLLRPVKKVEFGSLAWRSLFFFATILALTAYGWFTGHFDRMAGIVLLVLFGVYAWLNMVRSKSEEEETAETEESLEELAELLSEPLYHISNDYFLSYYLQWPLLNGAPGENPFLPHYRLWCMGLFARFPARDRVVLLR